MIEKSVHKGRLDEEQDSSRDRHYWLSCTPEERITAVETLRRRYHGYTGRLRRTVRIIKQV
ncbi:MAG: hypothetical protein R6V67_08075 [Spirochaetia bacterium]